MRTLTATALLAYATANSDETSLMQDLIKRASSRTLEATSSRQDTVAKLLDTAVAMMKNGVTPDVVNFVEATTESNQEVFRLIIDDHILEQNYVNGVCQRFTDAIDALDDSKEEIQALRISRAGARTAHQDCRADESQRCGNQRRCEAELITLWRDVVREESVMRQKHDEIEGGWCVEERDGVVNEHGAVNGWQSFHEWLTRPFDASFWAQTHEYPELEIPAPVQTFRTRTVTHFQEYMTQKGVVWNAWQRYNLKAEECANLERDWEAVIPDCDEAQQTAHQQACAHAEEIKSARTTIGTTWSQVTVDLNHQLESRRQQEESRKREWETLSIVQCLLDHVHSAVFASIDTGAPCPTLNSDPEGVQARIEQCHTVETGCDAVPKSQYELYALAATANRSSTHLCITACEVPDPPTLPALEAPPCTPAYIAEEFGPWGDDQWPGCAPPLACVDCSGEALAAFTPVEPVDETFQHYACRLHEEYLSRGQSNVDTFRCVDQRCLDQRGRCNGRAECGDGSDEEGCDTLPGYERSYDLTEAQTDALWDHLPAGVVPYVSSSFTCPDDFHSDVHYRCGTSDQCIEKVGRCNNFNNCADGSDEAACSAGELTVTVETTSGRDAEVISTLATGEEVFGDRGYTFDSLGDMEGKIFIKYSNDDKMIEHDHVMTKLRTNAPVRVFITTTSSHHLPWTSRWSESSAQGPSFSGVKMTRHKEWKLEYDEGLHKLQIGDLWHDDTHGRLATAHWHDGETDGAESDRFTTQHVYYKDFPAGAISISGNAMTTHYDGELSDRLDAEADGSFLIFLERLQVEETQSSNLGSAIGGWEMIAHQDVRASGGGYFPLSVRNSFTHNSHDNTAPLFMSIGNLDRQDYLVDGKFHLRLEYTSARTIMSRGSCGENWEGTQEAEWTQTSWFTDSVITGFEAVSPSNLGQATTDPGCQFHGLRHSSARTTAIDGSDDHGYWFHAVGSTQDWNGGIPAFRGTSADTMTLWVQRA